MRLSRLLYFVVLCVISVIFNSCSTKKNTAGSRWWHSFNANYNTYYNGNVAYIDGSLEKENGNKDNFTEMIPLFTVGNKSSRDLGKANFDRAIEKSKKAIHLHSIKARPEWNKSRKKTAKDREWLNRREYNPFLWKAWFLMGRAQFQQGDFEGAAATFSYMSRLYETQPPIYGRARAWLARCYTELDWMYDAEDVIHNMKRDSMDWRAVKAWDCTYADYYIHQKQWDEALFYLRRVIKREKRRKQRAREYYLLGQIESMLGHNEAAYKAYKKAVAQNPPYELEFNARIAQTEVMASSNAKGMIRKLKRMARSDNNKNYLDQVYYAIGNIYMSQKDTVNAIENYEKGATESVRNGIEKGVLLLRLGGIYWDQEKYGDAKRCYNEAIGLIDKERKDYEEIAERSKILDELAPYTEAVVLQDSLQRLAKMPEEQRNKIIDKLIDDLKKKEKEEKRKAQLAAVAANQAQQAGQTTGTAAATAATTSSTSSSGVWYFYNPLAVSQGKQTFRNLWGQRANADNWQRITKTAIETAEDVDSIPPDSLAVMKGEGEPGEKKEEINKAADPHYREYYIAQVPFTDEQVESSNKIIQNGLYHSGVIFKDKLDNLNLSEKALTRIVNQYPGYEGMADVYYHLYLLYMRRGNKTEATKYLTLLKSDYPTHDWTTLLTDPNYEANARFGVHIEDSLYAATYDAFKAGRNGQVKANAQISAERFPLGAHRDKFMFVEGLGKLNDGDADGCVANMKQLVEKYPESEVSKIADMIIKGVASGKNLRGGYFSMDEVWNKRNIELNDSDTVSIKKFSDDRDERYVFMLVYTPDTLNENQLLYEMAKYNFTNFMVRNFDVQFLDADGLRRMEVKGFLNYDEALQYVRLLYSNKHMASVLKPGKPIIISESNALLLGKQFSYADYEKFYTKTLAPLKISPFNLLTEPEPQDAEKQFVEQDRVVRRQEKEREKQEIEQKAKEQKEENEFDILPQRVAKDTTTEESVIEPIQRKEEKVTETPVIDFEKAPTKQEQTEEPLIEQIPRKEETTTDDSFMNFDALPRKNATEDEGSEIEDIIPSRTKIIRVPKENTSTTEEPLIVPIPQKKETQTTEESEIGGRIQKQDSPQQKRNTQQTVPDDIEIELDLGIEDVAPNDKKDDSRLYDDDLEDIFNE